MAGQANAREGTPGAADAIGKIDAAENIATTINGQAQPEDAVYRPRSIKRFRRTKAAVGDVRAAIYDVLADANPQTVRQVFYALTVRGVIKKIEGEYKQTVIRLLTEMR